MTAATMHPAEGVHSIRFGLGHAFARGGRAALPAEHWVFVPAGNPEDESLWRPRKAS
jgi:hypothetical protein